MHERRGLLTKKKRRGDQLGFLKESRGDRAIAKVMRGSNVEREKRSSNRLLKREVEIKQAI